MKPPVSKNLLSLGVVSNRYRPAGDVWLLVSLLVTMWPLTFLCCFRSDFALHTLSCGLQEGTKAVRIPETTVGSEVYPY